MIDAEFTPRLARKARLRVDRHTGGLIIVYPERGLTLNASAAEIVKRCDGTKTIAEIVRELEAEIELPAGETIAPDVIALVEELERRGLLSDDDEPRSAPRERAREVDSMPSSAPRPYTLIAELTYRCPLKCPYCSNPTNLAAHDGELGTDEWKRVFTEAEELGVMQIHLTGGEPLARKDLEALVEHARGLDLFTNLVTSGVPLTKERLRGLADRGLDHVQVSIQSARPERSDVIAGYPGFTQKLDVMRWVRELGLPLTMNVVLHRANLDEIEELVALAEDVGASRLELANTQYVSWALLNRDLLLPTAEQLDAAHLVATKHKKRLAGKIDVLFVKPDYFGTTPKACMDGWARRFVHLVPDGRVLPCHAASCITTLSFDNVKDKSLAEIWTSSKALNAYRGDAWMPEPCKSCEKKTIDFGGCRCQAFALTGDAAVTDPACQLAPRHDLVTEARLRATRPGRPTHAHENASASTAGEVGPTERRYLYRGR